MSKKIPTPLCDANAFTIVGYPNFVEPFGEITMEREPEPNGSYVDRPFAQKLERENARLRIKAKLLRQITDCYFLKNKEGLLELMMQANRLLPVRKQSK